MSDYIFRYIPPVYSENDELNELYKVEKKEIIDFNSEKKKVFENNFIKLANLDGIKKYEKILNINVDIQLSIEERRADVINTLLWKPPFTKQRLLNILKNIWGDGNYYFEIHDENYNIIIDVTTDSPSIFLNFQNNIKKIIPANLYIIFAVQYTYMYLNHNYTYGELAQFTYGELSQYAED